MEVSATKLDKIEVFVMNYKKQITTISKMFVKALVQAAENLVHGGVMRCYRI